MTGFLQSLAGIAVGDRPSGAARTALPPRFAPSVRPLPSRDEATTDLDPRDGVLAPRSMPAAPREQETTVIVRVPAAPDRPLPIHVPVDRTIASASLAARQPTEPSAVAPTAGPARDRNEHDAVSRAPAATPPAPARIARPQPAIVAPILRSQPDRVAPPATVAPPPPAGRAAPPLSSSVLALRIDPPRDGAPVINITIDRIDVRAAPAEAAKPSPRRSRPVPSQSLADYLRTGRAGGLR